MHLLDSSARAAARLVRRRRDRTDLLGRSASVAMALACLAVTIVELADQAEAEEGRAPTTVDQRADVPGRAFDQAAQTRAAAPATTTTVAPTTTTTLPPDPRIAAPGNFVLPTGKGMWIWQPEAADGGDPHAIVARAKSVGLTHLFIRTGSSRSGFHGEAFLDQLVPVAHDAGLQVFGWDFPYLDDVDQDIGRALAAIHHDGPGGHRLDGFVPDIETPAEGTNLTAEGVTAYLQGLRSHIGPDYPLLAAVPRPSDTMQGRFPYDAVMPHVSAVAPMVYWLNREPDSDVAHTLQWFARYGKPVVPIGQAYDGAPEGGRPGVPPPDEIERFLGAAEHGGAPAVSFWSWQHADGPVWDTLAATSSFRAP